MRHSAVLLLLLALFLPVRPAVAQAANGSDAISLRPGDVIKVQIWREEDLSGEFLVDQDGLVTFPLIGEQRVEGVPLRELRLHLTEEFRKHLRNPAIEITPLRRVNVLGEVQKPGLYPIDPTVSLAGAVAIAGGATPEGDLNRILVLRGGEVLVRSVGPGVALSALDVRSGDQIFVERRGWLDRNSTVLLTTGLSMVGSIVTTLLILTISDNP
jgi:protein involved in polysaccharide export with SLBB domain